MKNIFEIFELIISEDNWNHGVQAISLVDEGAIERDFVHFKKEHIVKLEVHDEEKRMVMGPVLVPNKMILRASEMPNEETQYFYVHFSEKTVRETAQRFMELGNQDQATYQHEMALEGVTFIESWVKESMEFDKSMVYGDGYKDMPVGTWFAMARIDDDKVWEEIKAGKINAFSIEGKFVDAVLKQSKQNTVDAVIEEIVDSPEDLKKLNDIIDLLNSIDENETDNE